VIYPYTLKKKEEDIFTGIITGIYGASEAQEP